MTSGSGSVLATRTLAVGGKRVLVTIGRPCPDQSAEDSAYICRIDIDGMAIAPIRLESSADTPARTVAIGLRRTAEHLDVGLAELLSDANIGIAPYRHPAAGLVGSGPS
ncbi:hypothetical protein [Nocardia anaemiae]|uniref:hypothetical protein n=1 Tax=Nocardia anaemiae TaxID=263910 RepID=UPI0012F48E31|nr:hypothetical protein [Nocardia anaemiae]